MLEERKVSVTIICCTKFINYLSIFRVTTEATAQTSETLTYEAEIQTAELKSTYVSTSFESFQ